MAGRARTPTPKPAAGASPGASDLTATSGLEALSGQRVVDIGRKTLEAADRLVGTWADLEPLAKLLITRLKAHVEQTPTDMVLATKLLTEVSRVSHAIAAAATNVMRAGDGQIRLAVLLEGPPQTRKQPSELTEKQLVGVVLETARRIKAEQGTCPLCTTTVDVTASPMNGSTTAPPEG